MDTELERMVRELHDKQAIRDVVHRYGRGVDRQDMDLLLSCYHPDAIDDHGMFVGPAGEFFDWTDPSHLRFFRTHQHIMTNHTCHLEGNVAHCETYWMFAGMTADGDHLATYGGRYIDRMEKREGEWRIAARKCVLEWWGEGMVTPDAAEAYAAVGTIARNRTDCSYERPLKIDPRRIGIRMGI
ncbi:MAG: nuclear transport factor 2 family protein [Rhizomicrobium sp.]